MMRALKVLLDLSLLALAVIATIGLNEFYEDVGQSSAEQREDEFEQGRAEGKDTFPLTTPASRERSLVATASTWRGR